MIISLLGNQKVVITGDFNIDLAKPNNLSDKYMKLLLSNDLIQHVHAPSRLTYKSSTIIDHVVSNLKDIRTIVSHYQISDHQIVFALWGEGTKNKLEKLAQ